MLRRVLVIGLLLAGAMLLLAPPVGEPPAPAGEAPRAAHTVDDASSTPSGTLVPGAKEHPSPTLEDAADEPPPAASIYRRLIVEDRSNRPMPGLAVIARRFSESGEVREERRLLTDQESFLRFEGSGIYQLVPEDPFLIFEHEPCLIEPSGFGDWNDKLSVCLAGRIRGRVVDEAGRAVVGASISAWTRQSFRKPQWLLVAPDVSQVVVTTGAGGCFELPPIHANVQVGLLVSHPDFAVGRFDGVPGRARAYSDVPPIVLRRPVTVRFAVVDEQGEPIPEAEVTIRDASIRPLWWDDSFLTRDLTDEAGSVAFAGVGATAIEVIVRSSDHVPLRIEAMPVTGETQVLRLDEGKSISGRVRRSSGQPVAGRRITAHGQDSFLFGMGDFESTTDDHGRFEIQGLPEGTYRVRGDAIVPRREVLAGTSDLELVVHFGSISGRVINRESGEPVGPNVLVRIESGPPREDRGPAGTDSAGRFAFEGLPPGDYVLAVDVKDYAPAVIPIRLSADTHLNDLVIPLSRADRARIAVSGFVLDAATGEPIQGATVDLWSAFGSPTGTTSSDGRFRLEAKPGYHVLHVERSGYESYREGLHVVEPIERTIRLGRGRQLHGRVVRDGKPFAGAIVAAFRANACDQSRDDGSFSLSGIPAGAIPVVCRPPNEPAQVSVAQVPDEGAASMLIDLSAARGGIRGQARDGDTPLPFALLQACLLLPEDGECEIVSSYEAFADGEGRFEIRGLVAGRYRVGMRPADEDDSHWFRRIVDVPQEGFASCDLRVPDGSLELRIVDERGEPVVDLVDVELTADSPGAHVEPCPRSFVGGSGRWEGLGEGRYELWATSAGHGSFRGVVEVPGPPVTVRLRPMARVIATAGGSAASQRRIDLLLVPRDSGAAPARVASGEDVEAGRYEIVARLWGHPPVRAGAVELQPGETREIAIRPASESAALEVDLGGARAPAARIEIRAASGLDLASLAWSAWRLYVLEPGAYTVSVLLPDGRRDSEAVTLAAGEVRRVRLTPR